MTLAAIPQPKQRIDSVRFPYYSDHLSVRVIHGVGFRCYCSCGDDSGKAASYQMARSWGREHARTHR